jgi:hypothetical protein
MVAVGGRGIKWQRDHGGRGIKWQNGSDRHIDTPTDHKRALQISPLRVAWGKT